MTTLTLPEFPNTRYRGPDHDPGLDSYISLRFHGKWQLGNIPSVPDPFKPVMDAAEWMPRSSPSIHSVSQKLPSDAFTSAPQLYGLYKGSHLVRGAL